MKDNFMQILRKKRGHLHLASSWAKAAMYSQSITYGFAKGLVGDCKMLFLFLSSRGYLVLVASLDHIINSKGSKIK